MSMMVISIIVDEDGKKYDNDVMTTVVVHVYAKQNVCNMGGDGPDRPSRFHLSPFHNLDHFVHLKLA